MNRVMTLVVGLGMTAAGVLASQGIEQRAEAVGVDIELVSRKAAAGEARHKEWMDLLERRKAVLPGEFERQSTFALAAADTNRHLRVDIDQGMMMLVEDGTIVRRTPIQVGAPLTDADGQTIVDITRGVRVVDQRIRDGQFEMPDWASWQGERPEPQRKRSRRKRRRPLPKPIDGLYGARTLVLDDGTVMYSTPGWGPWASDKDVRPGGIEMSFTNLAAVFGAISPGAHVYVY